MEKLDYIIKYLLKERNESLDNLPTDEENRKKLYRALVNIREAMPISPEFLASEDEFLQDELKKKNITDISDVRTVREQYENYNIRNSDKICLWQGDITKLKIGAIVNAANSQGLGCFIPNHNCIDNQIHTFAGVNLRLECNNIMKNINYNLKTGNAIITRGYNLPAKNVIHTVGPIIENEVTIEAENELSNCYKNSLELAIESGIRTIAFPCISTGVFRFPKDMACQIAIKSVDEFLSNNKDNLDKVVFNLWSDEDVIIYERYI